MKQLLSIQYLRAAAALAVVAFHSERAVPLGQAGVDLFFVISGFIMWIVASKPITPINFLWHRIVRILPLYWIPTLIMAVHLRADAWDVVRSLLFWPYRGVDGHVWPVLIPGWTLNFEMFFYLLFAISLILPQRLQLMVLSGVIGCLSMAGFYYRAADPVLSTYTSPLMMEFLFGVWISHLSQRHVTGIRLAAGLCAAGVIGLLASIGGDTPQLWRFAIWGGPAALIVWGMTAIEQAYGIRNIRVFKLLGDCSYSTYLFHPFVVRSVTRPLAGFPALLPVAAAVAAGAAIGVAAYYLLERPMTSWLRRQSARILTWRAAAYPSQTPLQARR